MGPLLFLIYYNDFVKYINHMPLCFLTIQTIQGKCVNNLVELGKIEMSRVTDCTVTNKLSLNVNKTKFMTFSVKLHFTYAGGSWSKH